MSSFLDACGATGPLRWTVERRGATGAERLVLDSPLLVVGRDPGCDLQLRHPEVSDRHAYLQLVGGRLFCLDLGSRTGTYVDGRCHRSGWIEPGESIRIGPYRLRLQGGHTAGKADAPAESEPAMSLELAHRSIRSTFCPLAAGMTLLGSAEECQARLLDPGVSAHHCSLIQTAKGIWAVDLLGRGSVAINGTRARLGRIYEGDELRVGGSCVRLRAGTPNVASAEAEAAGAGPSLVPALALADPRSLAAGADLRPLLAELPPDQAELARTLLVPLANQFGLMQQQMFDRMQQAERERFRAFAEFQREQFGSLHEELDQLHELRQELDELRAELKAQGRTLPSARDRASASASASAATSRPRLGSAAPQSGAPALEPPGAPKVLRMSVGEAS